MNRASTEWKEQIAADEDQRFAFYASQMVELQKRKSMKYGPGRALHRKQISAAQGTLTVLEGIPDFARNGIFSVPKSYPVWVRLSNGGMDRASDRTPDIRGFALKVWGVVGNSALDSGPAQSQDFSLINQEKFAFAQSAEFIDFVLAASRGNAALLNFLFRRYGLLGGPARLLKLLKSVGRPFAGFANNPFFSAVPIACGPFAVRLRLLPSDANGPMQSRARDDWAADIADRLRAHPLQWDLQLQPFVNEKVTPIEDASVDWDSPYSTVARLNLPVQDLNSEDGKKLLAQVEANVFDPWQALVAHRPLGEVQRARKVIYFASQKARAIP